MDDSDENTFDCYQILVAVKVYTLRGNKNIFQNVWKFGIIIKWKICCRWNNGKDFGNFEVFLWQDILFDTKLEPAIGTSTK